jgi:hypothetical protein
MKVARKILLTIVIVFVGIQFIQPPKNKSEQEFQTDISHVVIVPAEVKEVLKTSCYDCHSNNTEYPWYSFIQPAAWWMSSHIKEGKADLNFSEFGNYTKRKQGNKLEAIVKSIQDETMPLSSYTLLHAAARLSGEKKVLVINWATTAKDSLTSLN